MTWSTACRSFLLVTLWLAGGRSRRSAALLAFALAMVALGLNQLIGIAWYQPRPFVIVLSHAWAAQPPDASFPSDHLTLFTSIGLGLLFGQQRPIGLATLTVGLLVGWTRVYVGLDFPLDMVGSLVVASRRRDQSSRNRLSFAAGGFHRLETSAPDQGDSSQARRTMRRGDHALLGNRASGKHSRRGEKTSCRPNRSRRSIKTV